MLYSLCSSSSPIAYSVLGVGLTVLVGSRDCWDFLRKENALVQLREVLPIGVVLGSLRLGLLTATKHTHTVSVWTDPGTGLSIGQVSMASVNHIKLVSFLSMHLPETS